MPCWRAGGGAERGSGDTGGMRTGSPGGPGAGSWSGTGLGGGAEAVSVARFLSLISPLEGVGRMTGGSTKKVKGWTRTRRREVAWPRAHGESS